MLFAVPQSTLAPGASAGEDAPLSEAVGVQVATWVI